MWKVVLKCKHTVLQVYTSPSDPLQVVLRGSVKYELKEGGEMVKGWSAAATLTEREEGFKLKEHIVYLVSSPVDIYPNPRKLFC